MANKVTNKLYYTDLLEAAYMAREHSVVFTKKIIADSRTGTGGFGFGGFIDIQMIINPPRLLKLDKRLSPYKTPFYIHPESYHIFKPSVRDQAYSVNLKSTYRVVGWQPRRPNQIQPSNARECNMKIIQRQELE